MILDWDDAYDNVGHISNAGSYPGRWAERAAAFRDAMVHARRAELNLPYGEHPRARFDLFFPTGRSKGLMVFVHGGYWKAFDKSHWSHLAGGMLAEGWSVAMPSYVLAPEARLSEMTTQIVMAISAAAARVDGPVLLAGHSAGGHLVTRMACKDVMMPQPVRERIRRILSISGLHDLRPLLRTGMNRILQLDSGSARTESSALADSVEGIDLVACFGEAELPEFRRQAELLANIWSGLGARTGLRMEPGRHHFDVIDGLEPNGSLTAILTADHA